MAAKTQTTTARRSARKKAATKKTETKAAAKAGKGPAGKNTQRRPRGRPTKYSTALGERICEYLIHGYTLRQIGAMKEMPQKTTIIRWLARIEEFADQYARAREVQALVTEDEIQEIADDSRNDWVERELPDGSKTTELNKEAIARARLRIDTRKWLNSVRNRRYGTRSVELTGKDGGPIQTEVASILDEIDGADTGLDDGGGA